MTKNIKAGWTRVAFGDVVQLSRERSSNPVEDGFDRYVGLDHLDPGDLKIRRWGNILGGTTFTNVFRQGQVLFGKRRAYQHKLAVADFDGVCSGDIYVFEPKNDQLLPALLPYICQSDTFFEHAVGTSAGSLSPRTNWESLAGYEFALPPLEEQRRIADVVLSINSLDVRFSDLLHATSRTLTSACVALTHRHTDGRELSLTDVGEILDNRRVPVNDSERSKRSGIVPYFGANGQVGTIDKAIFFEPLILIPEDGGAFKDFATREMCYRVNEPCWVNNHAHVIYIADSNLRDFIYFTLLHADWRSLIVGTTRAKLTLAALKEFRIWLPKEVEMKQLLQLLKSLEATIQQVEERRRKLSKDLCIRDFFNGAYS